MMHPYMDRVLIDISKDEFDLLLMLLGYAYGCSVGEGGRLGRLDAVTPRKILQLSNAINKGNPQWTPYEIPPEGA